MSRIRHATEIFVNQMIDTVKKLIESNTNKINVLSVDRGYKDSSVHGSGDMNTFTNNGKYYGKNLTNMPTGSWSVFDVTNNGGDWDVAQIVHATDQGISHIRYKNGISWKVKQIATTDKTDILLKNQWAPSGYNARATMSGKICILEGYITGGVKTNNTVIGTLPQPFIPSVIQYVKIDSTSTRIPITVRTNGDIMLEVTVPQSDSLWLSCQYSL